MFFKMVLTSVLFIVTLLLLVLALVFVDVAKILEHDHVHDAPVPIEKLVEPGIPK